VRTEAARLAWRAAVATRDPERFVFGDERSPHPARTRLSGWAPRDRRASGSVPRTHGQTTTVGTALTPAGLRDRGLIAGAMATATCAWSLTQPLAPRLRPGQVLVRDHLSAHPCAHMREALEARGGARRFLPPSSPACPPSAHAFSKRTASLRGLGARTREA
jgi:hypothetical protein